MLIDYIVNINISQESVINPMTLFEQRFEALSKQVTPDALSENEIIAEIKAYRREKTAKENI